MVRSTSKGFTSCSVRRLMLLAVFALSACVATLSTGPNTVTRSSYRHLKELPDTTSSALSENRINSYYDSLKAIAQQLEVGILTAVGNLLSVLLGPIGRLSPKAEFEMIVSKVSSSLDQSVEIDYYDKLFEKLLNIYGEPDLEKLIKTPDLGNEPILSAMKIRLHLWKTEHRPGTLRTRLNVKEMPREENSNVNPSVDAMVKVGRKDGGSMATETNTKIKCDKKFRAKPAKTKK
ncbi:hypothetical protein CCR75_004526 [Bremia lactucae]|uniref:Uncharacterized protein n=1 Tax=Bremia lactucae TaxID=4779 RepID=A0A976FIY0_BRELC|nr:hypothetical protein CCR75_004526 [Bremia lactucae]